jgi:hypothetical protein
LHLPPVCIHVISWRRFQWLVFRPFGTERCLLVRCAGQSLSEQTEQQFVFFVFNGCIAGKAEAAQR